jgi:uncharacterized protein (TIGR03437 family)
MRKAHLLVFACLGLFLSHLNAQTVFLLPGPVGATSNVAAYTVSPFTSIGGFVLPNSDTSAFQVISRSDGGEFYAISNSSSNTVVTTNSLLGNVQSLVGFGTPATAAILSPDGRRLLVAAGNLQIVNTVNDSLAITSGIGVGGTAMDVDASIDSTQAFVLVNTGNGFELNDVDLRLLESVKTLAISAQASGVTVGPNGLIYVGVTNALLEIDPTTLTVRNSIATNGTPGKPAFTPDGTQALAPNLTPSTQVALFDFNLTLKTVVSPPITTTALPNAVSQVFVVGNNQAFAFSASSGNIYSIQINSQGVTSFPFVTGGSISFAAVTTDLATTSGQPVGTHTTTKYLLFASSGTLYQLDIANNQIVGTSPISGSPGALSIATPANTAGFPTTVLAYGDQQTVPLGVSSAPLVVRAVDLNGKPVVGVGVTFTTSSSASIQTSSALTNDNGLASTTITSSATGAVQIVASVGSGLGYTFTVNVGAAPGGGGGTTGGSPSALTIVSGQGVIVPAGSSISAANGSPNMGVVYTDTNGNPIAGATITFTQVSGMGTLECPSSSTEVFTCLLSSVSSLSISTDLNGLAQSDYQAGIESSQSSNAFSTATITATAPNGSTATFYVTSFPSQSALPTLTVSTPPGSTFSGSAGQATTGAITGQFSSFTGAAIPNVSLRILSPDPTKGPSASCAGTFAMSNAGGTASCTLVLAGLTGSTSVLAEVGYVQDFGPFNIDVTAGVPGKITILQGNNQSGKPGQVLPTSFLVQVTDASGNVLPQTPVTWKVLNGTITLSQVSSTTNANGRATALGTLGNTPGTAQVEVTAGSGSSQVSATFTVTITVPIGGMQIVSGNNQSAAQNAAFPNPLVVEVTDANGNPVPGQSVTFTVTSGSATVATASATSTANGTASTAVSAGGTAGAVVVTASSNGFTVTFNLTIIPPGPANIVFLNGASLEAGASAGAIVTIQGTGLASGVNGVVLPNNILGPLPTSLAGVSVTFNGTLAPIFSVSNVNGVQQVTVQLPYEVAGLASASVVITVAGGGSGTFTVNLTSYSPGIFTTNVFGLANQIVAIRPDGSYVSPSNPAQRGETIIIFLTGLGQTSPLTGTNEAGIPNQNIVGTIAVGFNNAGVPYISAQTVVGLVGVYAITVQVPANTTPGPQQPVGFISYDSSGNAIFANGPVIPIQ